MDEDVLFNTAKENAHNFLKIIEECGITEFLKRENYIALRSCTTTELLHQACGVMTADIDGVVSEHFNLSGITHPLRYINILPSGSLSLIPMFKLLRKLLPLINYTKESNRILKESVGAQIYSDGGWQFMVTILPKEDCQSNIDGNSYRALVFDWLSQVKQCMLRYLTQLNDSDLNRVSVKKNRLNDVSKWTLSPNDLKWYMQLLDSSFETTDVPHGFEMCMFSTRCGERQQNSVNLTEYVDISTVKRLSVHAAVLTDFSPANANAFWSKDGLYRLIGNRGQIWKSLTIAESCNFQSNLDGRRLDIRPGVYNLARKPETLQFVQFYSDTPHLYPIGKNNPISGMIGTVGLLHPKSVAHLQKCATEYNAVMEENASKICFPIRPRVEIVCMTNEIAETLCATDYINPEELMRLMNEYALLIPISETIIWKSDLHVANTLKQLCLHLTNELRTLYDLNKGLGGFFATWRSFQIECALEILFYGKSLSFSSRQIANLLVSKRIGILTLEEPNSTTVDENETPPLNIWTQAVEQQKRIARAFKFTNYLSSTLPV